MLDFPINFRRSKFAICQKDHEICSTRPEHEAEL